MKDEKGNVKYTEQICLVYSNDKKMAKLYGLSITVIIISINVILKKLIVRMFGWIGFDTVSKEMGMISKGVFAAQFFNTGIIILIVNANLSEHQPKQLFGIFKGPFSDYMP